MEPASYNHQKSKCYSEKDENGYGLYAYMEKNNKILPIRNSLPALRLGVTPSLKLPKCVVVEQPLQGFPSVHEVNLT
jgi:hypothetical protein